MATSEDLVPKGRDYGQRQETRAAMQDAGLPLSSAGATEQAPAVGGRPSPADLAAGGGGFSPLDMLDQTTPGDFQFLSDPEQVNPAAAPSSEPESPLAALAASAQSTFAAAVLSRLARR